VRGGQRLLIFTDNAANVGDYPSPGGGRATVMDGQDATVENYWSLGDTIFSHDWSCRSRWGSVPLNAGRVSFFPGKSWPRLFVMNQFHGVGETLHARSDNKLSHLWARVHEHCLPRSGRLPNFIAVDFYHQGDDWTTIFVKRDIRRVEIGSFEVNVDDADIQVVHHGNNGLDGKVSYVSLATGAP
jgi:hypothetical protein